MVAKVIVDISSGAVDRVFDYIIPSNLDVQEGDRLSVPFGNKSIEGFCISIAERSDGNFKLKEVTKKLDEKPLISREMLALMRYMKDAYYIRYIDSLRLFLPPNLRGGKVKEQKRIFVTLKEGVTADEIIAKLGKRAKAQAEVVRRLEKGGEYLTALNSEYSNAAVKALADKGYVVKEELEVYRKPFTAIKGESDKVTLKPSQIKAVENIASSDKSVILLHGVTGSGKTEVYLNSIDRAIEAGKTAIMLVPEISLTPQMLRIFRARYGDTVAMLHSGLSAGERYDEWRRLFSGEARVALGARSAIFAPLSNLGLIIIDEEHDGSYISESNPRYSTAAIAKFRAEYNGAKVVLGSATPSIDTYLKAKKGEYALVTMNERITDKGMPDISVIDMARELKEGNTSIFSRQLSERLGEEITKGNQAMIFLNRRGYSSFMMCKECGYIAKCADCDVSLTYHNEDDMLKCHYCGKRYKALTKCPECGSDKLKQGKVGTERVAQEIKKMFPGVSVLRMDNDTTATKTAYLEILGAFAAKEAQVLVGTQMIAKGHDFPDVTLVGVLDADMSLYFSDYRSTERTFQLITQVAGRAGRAEKAGQVLIQTYSPRHYVFNYIKQNNYIGFYDKEVNTREITNFPPFTTIIRVLIRSEKEVKAVDCAKGIFVQLKEISREFASEFVYIQAMKAPIARLEKFYRYQIIMRIKRPMEDVILRRVHSAIDNNKVNDASVFVEINPLNMS